MMSRVCNYVVMLAIVSVIATSSVAAANIVYNSSFEGGSDSWTSLGQQLGWGNMSGLYGTIETTGAWHGSRCLKIDLGPGLTSTNYFDCYWGGEAYQKSPKAVSRGWMDVTPGATYTVSAYLKVAQAGPGVAVGCYSRAGTQYGTFVYPTTTWQRYSHTFTVPAGTSQLFVGIGPWFSDPDPTATVWIDAVQLEQASAPTTYASTRNVEIGLSTGKYGNVFSVGESPDLNVCGYNSTQYTVNTTLYGTLTDFFGTVVATPQLNVNIPAYGSVSTTWTLPLPGKGYYKFQASYNAFGTNYSVNIMRLALIQPYTANESPFGMNHIPETDNVKDNHHKIGMTWYRSWAFLWDAIEHTQGTLDWTVLDDEISWVRTGGNNVLAEFHQPSTLWNSSDPYYATDDDVMRRAYPPTNLQLMYNFLGTEVARYTNSVTYWEFLNEPTSTDWALPRTRGFTPVNYVSELQGAYSAIKAANGSAIVVGGPQDNGSAADDITRQFIDANGLAYLDILSLHCYPKQEAPETYIPRTVGNAVAHMNAHGQNRPIWVTEFACWGVDDRGEDIYTWDYSWDTASELIAAKYNARASVMMLANGVQKIFFQSTGEGSANFEWPENPLVNMQGEPRKSYAVMAALANVLGENPTYAGSAIQSNIYQYAFNSSDGRGVLVAWYAVDNGWGPRLAMPAGCNAYNFEGNTLSPDWLYLRDVPLYIESTTLTGAQLLSQCHFVPTYNPGFKWTLSADPYTTAQQDWPDAVNGRTAPGAPVPGPSPDTKSLADPANAGKWSGSGYSTPWHYLWDNAGSYSQTKNTLTLAQDTTYGYWGYIVSTSLRGFYKNYNASGVGYGPLTFGSGGDMGKDIWIGFQAPTSGTYSFYFDTTQGSPRSKVYYGSAPISSGPACQGYQYLSAGEFLYFTNPDAWVYARNLYVRLESTGPAITYSTGFKWTLSTDPYSAAQQDWPDAVNGRTSSAAAGNPSPDTKSIADPANSGKTSGTGYGRPWYYLWDDTGSYSDPKNLLTWDQDTTYGYYGYLVSTGLRGFYKNYCPSGVGYGPLTFGADGDLDKDIWIGFRAPAAGTYSFYFDTVQNSPNSVVCHGSTPISSGTICQGSTYLTAGDHLYFKNPDAWVYAKNLYVVRQ
ncbi:MAG: glycosyl hydrolase [Armatimonadota bacterium]